MKVNEEGRTPTAEVLVKLMAAESFQAFYAENIDVLQLPALPEYLTGLCERKGILPHRLFRETDIEKSLGHQIFSGRRRLSRDNALKMAFGLELDIKEAQRLLTISKNSRLYPYIPRDAAILYCLHHEIDYRSTQDNLFEWGMTVLGDDTKHEKPGN
jgi:hypothetical protein